MSRQTKEMSLHNAAKTRRVGMIRKLLYNNADKQCDPATLNVYGKTSAFMYFINLLNKANDCGSDDYFTTDEITCFTELLWFTYDTQRSVESERKEIFDMLDYCFQFSDVPIRKLFIEIVNVFIMWSSHHRRYFVEKILAAKLPSDYCLISAMFDPTDLWTGGHFVSLTSNFLSELFALFIANASFFEEYLPEVMSSGWTFNVPDQSRAFCLTLANHQSIVSVFGFMKHMILYQIDFISLLKCCVLQLPPIPAENITINAFVPLSNFVNAPIDLARTLRRGNPMQSSYYNFNETEDVLHDFTAFVEMEPNSVQVVSLKNLARMSIRKCVFRNHTHYKGLSLLYSLNGVPVFLRNFLCYNYCNFKF